MALAIGFASAVHTSPKQQILRLPLRISAEGSHSSSRLLNPSIFSCQRSKLQQQPLRAPSSVDNSFNSVVNCYFMYYTCCFKIERSRACAGTSGILLETRVCGGVLPGCGCNSPPR